MNPKRMALLSVSLAVFALGALELGGCKATLAPGGAYAPGTTDTNGVFTATAAPDYELYVTDSAFALAHDSADAVFNFERNHRLQLWQISPSIKHAVDAARIQAKVIDLKYATARAAYMAAPQPAGMSTLQSVLALAQANMAAAQAAIAAVPVMVSTNAPPAAPVSAPGSK